MSHNRPIALRLSQRGQLANSMEGEMYAIRRDATRSDLASPTSNGLVDRVPLCSVQLRYNFGTTEREKRHAARSNAVLSQKWPRSSCRAIWRDSILPCFAGMGHFLLRTVRCSRFVHNSNLPQQIACDCVINRLIT